jgi:uncharacterized protein with PQ loop repeat
MISFRTIRQQKIHAKLASRKGYLDRVMPLVAIGEPMMAIPQAYKIIQTHEAAAISVVAWAGYEILAAVWLWYGFSRQDRYIVLHQSCWIVVQTVILATSVKYGARW